MLSKQAFNGLLKTLEEPPPRLKFILATTEVRKIPVTILSRCQRFDLKRVGLEKLLEHLKKISKLEEGKISEDALMLIARASEGSVRDGISLLDRALISQTIEEKEIQAIDVRKMLGLADKSRIISLFKEILSGNQKEAVINLKDLINSGLDAKLFLNDVLEILYLFGRRINLGPIDKDMLISENELQLIDQYSKNLNMEDLGLFWQLTIKTIDDLRIVSNENLTLEMYIMQLVHLKEIKEDLHNQINVNLNTEMNMPAETETPKINNKDSIQVKSQMKNTEQVKKEIIKNPLTTAEKKFKVEIKNIQDLIDLANKEQEVELRYDLERNVKLVKFDDGKIDISFNEKLNKNFIKNLTEKLLKWTGKRWIISLSKNGGEKTVFEKKTEEKKNTFVNENKSETSKKILSAFPDAKLIDIKKE